MTLFTVDVSHHNGTLDWARISRAGVFAGMAKATQGASFVDSQYANNIRGMRGAGLVPGAYHFLTNENASSQVSHFLSHAGDIAGSAVMLDVEPNGSGTMKPTMASVRAFYSVWASRVPGKPLLLYLPYWYWLELGSPSLTGLGPLVASHYLTSAATDTGSYAGVPSAWWSAYGGVAPALLQFSESAQVGGYTVDLNAYRGDENSLRALTGTVITPLFQGDDVTLTITDKDLPSGFKGSSLRNGVILGVATGGDSGANAAWLSLGCDGESVGFRVALRDHTGVIVTHHMITPGQSRVSLGLLPPTVVEVVVNRVPLAEADIDNAEPADRTGEFAPAHVFLEHRS